MKYRLTEETKELFGRTLYRIQAIRDIPRYNVKTGDFGGFIESEENLSHLGDCWVSDNACVFGNARVSGDAEVFGNAFISGNATVYGDALVSDNAKVVGNAWISGNAKVYGNTRVSDNATVYGNAWVYGGVFVFGDAMVHGGTWTTSPHQVEGSRHFVNMCTKELLKIGCYKKPISWWIENYREIGEREGYTEEQIQEYYGYILEAQELYK